METTTSIKFPPKEKPTFIEGCLYSYKDNNSIRIVLCTSTQEELIGIEIYHESNSHITTVIGYLGCWISEQFEPFIGEVIIKQE